MQSRYFYYLKQINCLYIWRSVCSTPVGIAGLRDPAESVSERGGSMSAPRKASDKLRKTRLFKTFSSA